MRKLSIISALAVLLPAGAFAAFEDIGLGARSQGLANSVAALDCVDSMALNPATMGAIRKFELGTHFLSSARTPQGRADFSDYSFNFVYPKLSYGKLGTFGFATRYRTDDGFGKEREVYFGYGTWQMSRTAAGPLDFGVGFRLMDLYSSAAQESKLGFGLDVGAVLRPASKYALGFAIQNVPGPKFKFGNFEEKAPLTWRASAAQAEQDYTLTFDFSKRSASAGSAGSVSAASGFEYLWRTYRYGTFTSRTGLSVGSETSLLTLGFGYKHMASEFGYSLLSPLSGPLRLGHALSVTIRFGDKDVEGEYERLIRQEMKYRRDLMEALDESEKREKILRSELETLRSEVDDLSARLRDQEGKNEAVRENNSRLAQVIERQRRAEAELRSLEEKRKADKFNQLKLNFSTDWQSYLKLKAGGAPPGVRRGMLQRILTQYQDSGIDISQATVELQGLIGQ